MSPVYYAARRSKLVQLVKQAYPDQIGPLIISAAYEEGRHSFWQDSTFFYLTGIAYEPGAVLWIVDEKNARLYIPAYTTPRARWVAHSIAVSQQEAEQLGLQEIVLLGEPFSGYTPTPLFSVAQHGCFLRDMQAAIEAGLTIFMCALSPHLVNIPHLQIWERWCSFVPSLRANSQDCSAQVGQLRRHKDEYELQQVGRALEITIAAYQTVLPSIKPESSEAFIDAAITKTIIAAGARHAFPPIIAGGQRATILHYNENNQPLAADALLLIDCGAAWQGYAADLSRVYPVSRHFSARQRFLYEVVHEVQQEVRLKARPGLWLVNKEDPEHSLHHYAVALFKKYGLERFFCHSIGHFLGLDLHDVAGDPTPLRVGDLITIEPGLYLPHEQIGIRIEDNFVLHETGVTCLSDALVRTADEIEAELHNR